MDADEEIIDNFKI